MELYFQFKRDIDYKVLLDNILVDICDVSIQSSTELEDAHPFNGYVVSKGNSNAIRSSTDQKDQVEAITSVLKNFKDEKHILRNASADFFLEICRNTCASISAF